MSWFAGCSPTWRTDIAFNAYDPGAVLFHRLGKELGTINRLLKFFSPEQINVGCQEQRYRVRHAAPAIQMFVIHCQGTHKDLSEVLLKSSDKCTAIELVNTTLCHRE